MTRTDQTLCVFWFREKHSWRSAILVKLQASAGFSVTECNTPSYAFKLYKWYQIAQITTDEDVPNLFTEQRFQ